MRDRKSTAPTPAGRGSRKVKAGKSPSTAEQLAAATAYSHDLEGELNEALVQRDEAYDFIFSLLGGRLK